MDNLVAALEKADSLGVNIFSVSLGYSWFDNTEWTLPKSALDGQTTRASMAATIAARKGMLVCAAAGNEGDKPWQTISVPADADSILTVGAVDTLRTIGSFSSHGPSADNRVKPDVCAVGVSAALIDTNGEIVYRHGTSFATPLIAGLAATLWSALPDENAMKIRERIIRSADRYQNPDARQYGYGIPDAYAAYLGRTTTINSTANAPATVKFMQGNTLYIIRGGKIYDTMGRMVER
jgi:subtilisin family serine protease